MSDTATISFRTDPAIKREAKELYADMGMDLSTAINIFLRQSIRETACLSRSPGTIQPALRHAAKRRTIAANPSPARMR